MVVDHRHSHPLLIYSSSLVSILRSICNHAPVKHNATSFYFCPLLFSLQVWGVFFSFVSLLFPQLNSASVWRLFYHNLCLAFCSHSLHLLQMSPWQPFGIGFADQLPTPSQCVSVQCFYTCIFILSNTVRLKSNNIKKSFKARCKGSLEVGTWHALILILRLQNCLKATLWSFSALKW